MSSQRAKNIKMREKRAKWEDEIKERGLNFLKREQSRRAEEKRKHDEQVKDKKIAKSKRLAKAHKAKPQAPQMQEGN